jgi:hypothetical protein
MPRIKQKCQRVTKRVPITPLIISVQRETLLPLCFSCTMPLQPCAGNDEEFPSILVSEQREILDLTRAHSGYVGKIQQNMLEDALGRYPHATTVPCCVKCAQLTHRFLANKCKRARSGSTAHPIYEIVRFIYKVGTTTCCERRSIPGIVLNLATEVVVGGRMRQHNQIIQNGPATLQKFISWVQDGRVPVKSIANVLEGARGSYWLCNGLGSWVGSQKIAKSVRSFLRSQSIYGSYDVGDESE